MKLEAPTSMQSRGPHDKHTLIPDPPGLALRAPPSLACTERSKLISMLGKKQAG